ncbi:AAA family ATPase [Crocosphaera sp. UHCC 0190]|uniref:AAA family ATPase n=1 Tax=Crocosphaera sp. UHCC 0190 TaxID=3110246 RepID=UPI002B21DEA0|nr:AAA family ATPase [Crocosphaera sp. UHCC 0190]MEA5509416.1 AAA family ATPase [Crocosphaera sp. UHCC 0190]
MALTFQKLARLADFPDQARNTGYLSPNNWDDYGHKTLFLLTIFDEQGNEQTIGNIKIGFVGQNSGWTEKEIPQQFEVLPENFYSLGQDADYYENVVKSLSGEMAINVLTALGDVVHDPSRLQIAENEHAFKVSLLRSVNSSSIEHQFRRILRHEAQLTEYNFFYEKDNNERYSGIKVEFSVEPNTKPSSNIHILIGRNGVGKTTLLNNMIDALLPARGAVEETGYFATPSSQNKAEPIGNDYFAGVVSVSFSAFDPFTPPNDQPDANAGMRYHYIGLKKRFAQQEDQNLWGLKNKVDLCQDFIKSLKICFALTAKKARWINAVKTLESDFNFAEMDLCELVNVYADLSDNQQDFSERAAALFKRMSSGHAIVLLTVTKLVETVEEKTLVLLDEPESHLHPPLLSAFTRALSDLLVNRNGVAIIATHSPVVLQEVPKSCVSILRRTRLIANVDRPENETFAENVGILTREVFGLEVSKSGFHHLLANSVAEGKSYEEIEQEYQHQLGFEGKTILRSMIMIRDSQLGAIE